MPSSCGRSPIGPRTNRRTHGEVDGRPHDIIGIMPPGFDVMDNRTEIWLPIGIHPVIRGLRENHILQVVGRLKPGITPLIAETELATLLENWSGRAGIKGVLTDLERTFDTCHGLTNAGVARLARLPRLRELRVSGRAITSDVSSAFPARVEVRAGE